MGGVMGALNGVEEEDDWAIEFDVPVCPWNDLGPDAAWKSTVCAEILVILSVLASSSASCV